MAIEEIGDRIKAIRIRKGLSQSKLGILIGLTPQAVQKWEAGISAPRMDNLVAVAEVLTTPLSELVAKTKYALLLDEANATQREQRTTEMDPAAQRQRSLGRIPVITWEQAAQWRALEPTFTADQALGWFPIPFQHGSRAFGVRIEGESMFNPAGGKSYAPGEFIAVDPDRTPTNESTVVALIEDGKASPKQLIDDRDGTRMLKALNPKWPKPFIEIDSETSFVGTVIGKWVPE